MEEEKKELTAAQRILALLIMFAVLILGLSPIICIVCISTSFARLAIKQREQQRNAVLMSEQAIYPPSYAEVTKTPFDPII